MRTIAEEHTELFHYTNAAGLSGIVSSGTLWVTHFSFLNDHQEYRLFFEHRLPALLTAAIARAYERVKTHPHVTYSVRRSGGAAGYRDGLHHSLLPTIRKSTSELNTPYVACFCTAATPLIAAHGLLSQWRGYGTDGGYALVFDTSKMDRLLLQEGQQLKGMDFFIGDVEYYDDPIEGVGVLPETGVQTEEVIKATADFLVGFSPEDAGRIFTPIHRLAISAKHWGFREEREVRVVLSQPHESLVAALPEEHLLKPVRHFVRRGVPVPYMRIFDLDAVPVESRLPLRRVIVGPHPESGARKVAVELLLRRHGYNIPVDISAIPFRWG